MPEAPENLQGLIWAGFVHDDPLKTSFERRVRLDIAAVFSDCRGSDAAQLTTGQGWLHEVSCIHASLRPAYAYYAVYFVDEENHLGMSACLLDDPSEPLLELTPVLGPSHQSTDVQLDDALAGQDLWILALSGSYGQCFYNGCFPNTGLAYKHRVVLGAPGEGLDHLEELLAPTDERTELAFLGLPGEVPAVPRQIRGVGLRVLCSKGQGLASQACWFHTCFGENVADHVTWRLQYSRKKVKTGYPSCILSEIICSLEEALACLTSMDDPLGMFIGAPAFPLA